MKKYNFVLLFISLFLSLSIEARECKTDGSEQDKITICHAGNDNGNPGRVNFVDICVDFAAVHGHLKTDLLDTVGACGTTVLLEGSVYACNAGIKHEAPSQQVCYQRTNPSISCNPNVSCQNNLSSCNCVCSGTNGGANLVDFMSFKGASFSLDDDLEDISDFDFSSYSETSRTSITSMNSGFVNSEGFVVATQDSSNFIIENNSLSFNLGSELYGSEYFVDICWENINEDDKGEFIFSPKYSYKNKSFFGESYVETADVYSKTKVDCVDSDGSVFNLYDENYLLFPGQSTEISPQVGSVSDVSSCRVRHYFMENSQEFRAWSSNAIDVNTELEVVLSDDSTVVDEGIRLCHPITYDNELGIEVTQLCQLKFETSLEYRNFVLHHEVNRDNRSNAGYNNNHVNDFRALDGENCAFTKASTSNGNGNNNASLTIASPQVCMLQMQLLEDGSHHSNALEVSELMKALYLNF